MPTKKAAKRPAKKATASKSAAKKPAAKKSAAKKKPAAKETNAKPRTRPPKAAPRMKVVWGVFNNSNARVATYEYPRKREAEEHAARLRAEKNQTFFVQPVKEPMEEKK